jgi:hypothetical protein
LVREAVCFSILEVGLHDSFLYTWSSSRAPILLL